MIVSVRCPECSSPAITMIGGETELNFFASFAWRCRDCGEIFITEYGRDWIDILEFEETFELVDYEGVHHMTKNQEKLHMCIIMREELEWTRRWRRGIKGVDIR